MSRLKNLGSRVGMVTERVSIVQAADSWRPAQASSTQRGYGYKWQKAREQFLKENPLCEYHLKKDVIVPATVVDHKVPHRGDMNLFWDKKNWQSLCKHCHDSIKAKEEKRHG